MNETTTLDALARALDRLTQENAALRQEVEALRLALHHIEGFARDLPDGVAATVGSVMRKVVSSTLTERQAFVLEAVPIAKPMNGKRIAERVGCDRTRSKGNVRTTLSLLVKLGLVYHSKRGYSRPRD